MLVSTTKKEKAVRLLVTGLTLTWSRKLMSSRLPHEPHGRLVSWTPCGLYGSGLLNKSHVPFEPSSVGTARPPGEQLTHIGRRQNRPGPVQAEMKIELPDVFRQVVRIETDSHGQVRVGLQIQRTEVHVARVQSPGCRARNRGSS